MCLETNRYNDKRERERERVGENLLVGTFVGLTPE